MWHASTTLTPPPHSHSVIRVVFENFEKNMEQFSNGLSAITISKLRKSCHISILKLVALKL